MAKPSVRIAAIQFGFAMGVALILARAAQLQIVDHESWSAEARRTRTAKDVLPARRGALYDRNGVPFAITQEFYHVGFRARNSRSSAAGDTPRPRTSRRKAAARSVSSLGARPTW